MKKLPILLLAILLNLSTFSQEFKKFRISENIELIKISENAFVHVSYAELPNFGRFSSNGLIYIDNGKGFLFDTPITDTLTKELVNWLIDSIGVKIVGFVPNHWHNDCMGGIGYLQSIGIKTYANQLTISIAKAKNLPQPIVGFNDSLTLKHNDKLIECYYLGAAHSLDNIVVWIPKEKILFSGCMTKEINSKNLGNTADGDLIEYAKTIDKVINKFPDAKLVIPGHGKIGGLELLSHTLELSLKQK